MGTMMRSDPWSNPRWFLTGEVPKAAPNKPATVDTGARELIDSMPAAGAAAGLTLGILGLLRLGPEFLRRRPMLCAALCVTGVVLLARRARI